MIINNSVNTQACEVRSTLLMFLHMIQQTEMLKIDSFLDICKKARP